MFLSHLSKYIESVRKKIRQSFSKKNGIDFWTYFYWTSFQRTKLLEYFIIHLVKKCKYNFFSSSDRMKVGKNVIFSDAKIRVAEYLVFTLISRHRLLLLFFPKDMYSTKWNNFFSDFPKGKYYILICARKCRFSLMKVWKMMLLLYKFYRGLKS